MRLLVHDVEVLDDVAVIYGHDTDGERRSAVIAHDVVPRLAVAMTVSRVPGVALIDIDATQVITPDPFT